MKYITNEELENLLENNGLDDYSDCDGREELETLGDAGMDIYQ